MCWEGLSLGDVLVVAWDAAGETPTHGPVQGLLLGTASRRLAPCPRAWGLAKGCSTRLWGSTCIWCWESPRCHPADMRGMGKGVKWERAA